MERPQKCHGASQYTDNVSRPVQCRDLASDTARDQWAEDPSDEVSTRHPRTVGQTTKCGHLKEVSELPVEEQLKQRQL